MAASTAYLREELTPARSEARRRRVAHDVRRTRDRVSVAAGLNRSTGVELARLYAKNYLRGAPHHLLLTLALLSASTLWISTAHALAAAGLVGGVLAATAFACRILRRREIEPSALGRWRLGFMTAEALQAFFWLFALWPLFPEHGGSQGTSAHAFALVAVMLVMVSTAILRAPIFPAMVAGVLPLTGVIALVAAHADGIEEHALALLTFSAQFFFLYFAHRIHRGAVATIKARAEMQASLAELEQAKANSSEAWRRAEEADRAKAMFLATMSHELRTPLNAILGFSEVMKNEVLGSHSTPSYREYSRDIHGSGQHLLSLINEILELARIESGQYALREEPVRLGDVIRTVMAELEPYAEAKGHTVTPVVEASLEPIRVDPRAIRQIVGNLLSNAVKFTAPGGRITVKAGWTSLNGQYVSVSDDGPGIPAHEIPLVMSSFGRGSVATATAEQGAGLGLPIVKGLADLHGGRFVLKSKPREGTEAVVTLPAERVDAPSARETSQAGASAAEAA